MGCEVCAFNPVSWKQQSQPVGYSKFQASQGCRVRPCLRVREEREGEKERGGGAGECEPALNTMSLEKKMAQ